ncbi:MAG: TraR/DksA C4-type zinc finger protein [Thermacetogeniaceae bacterium]
MNQDQLQHFRQRLDHERARERELLDHLEEGLLGVDQRDALSELSVCDNHPADIGTETFERSKDIGLRDRGRVRLVKIDEALARLDKGSYGTCEHCGDQIPEARLEAVPETTLCVHCQEIRDAEDKFRIRPVEELAIAMPFGGVPGESNSTGNMYDGEDSWRDVARYGTSSDTVRHDEGEQSQEAGSNVEKIPYRRDRDGTFYQDLRARDDEGPPGGPV